MEAAITPEFSRHPEHIRALFTRNASSLATLTLLICEHILNLHDERRYIWRGSLNRVKAIYLVSRYLPLLGLTLNAILVFFGPLATLPNKTEHCRAWFAFLSAIGSLTIFSIDAIAMLRVYILYDRNPKIGAFFAALIITEATLVTTCSSTTLNHVPFTSTCNVAKTPWQVVYFASAVVIMQIALTVFTFHKRKVMAGQRSIPLVELVFRQGAWISSLISCILSFTVPYSLITGTSITHLVLIWPTCLLSIAACRIILDLHRFPTMSSTFQQQQSPRNQGEGTSINNGTDADIQFTSYFMHESYAGDYDDFVPPGNNTSSDIYEGRMLSRDHSIPPSLKDTSSLSELSLRGSPSSTSSISSI